MAHEFNEILARLSSNSDEEAERRPKASVRSGVFLKKCRETKTLCGGFSTCSFQI